MPTKARSARREPMAGANHPPAWIKPQLAALVEEALFGGPGRGRPAIEVPARSGARPRHAHCRGLCRMTGTEPHAWGTGLMDDITFVGLDVHKATVCIAVAAGGRGVEVRQ